MKKQEKFYIISCHVLWRELCYFASMSHNVFNFHFLEQGLHQTPQSLNKCLQHAIDSVSNEYSAILIGYGLCCNGIVDIAARDTRLVFMKAHDCITFFLGSREQYAHYYDINPGTYWYTPGWIDHASGYIPSKIRDERLLQTYIEKYGRKNAEYLMQVEHRWIEQYSKAVYVDLGFYDTQFYRNYAKQSAQESGWDYGELQGNPQLIMNFLEGNWPAEDFLIVEPGQKVIATYDENIIGIENLS